jgi:betaine-aldehyde dehydrogenase
MTAKLAQHWIDGGWVSSGPMRDSIDPSTCRVIGQYADGGAEEAAAAIAAARRAFRRTSWRDDKNLRAEVIEKMAARFEAHAPELIELLSLENGKIRSEAAFEVNMVASKLRYYGALTRAEKGESGHPRPGVVSMTVREPVGVVAVIVPWNSPVVLMIRSLAPALAAGNTVAVKMPAQTAQTNALIAKVLAEVDGLPPGVVNLFTESGGEGARLLVSSPDTAVISYTGSTHTGSLIAAEAGRLLKRCSLELGGKSPHIVFDDCEPGAIVPTLAHSVTVFAGQFCMAGSRLIVQKGIEAQIVDGIARCFGELRLGAALEAGSQMGPMIDKANVERVERAVQAAIAQGAEVIVRGGPVTEGPLSSGAFYRPTLLRITDPNLPIVREETFGPVMTVQSFDTEAEAIDMANASEYGLAASVWTQNGARAFRVAHRVEAGTVWLNDWAKVYDEFEEGGFKKSGLGRLNGPSALDDFVEIKHITLTTA